jgi:CubicO group peptidase (beta-lactamase class C family)
MNAICAEQTGAGIYANWRQRMIWGEVHDGNAYFLGGRAGHAGLFSTACRHACDRQSISAGSTRELLKPESCGAFRVNMTQGLEEARSLGWQLAQTKDSTAGPDLPSDSFGHNGFTGTSCWVDAQHDRVFILLTNRTHGRKLPFANINAVRRQFHSLAVKELSDML